MDTEDAASQPSSPRAADRMLRTLEALSRSDEGRTLAALSKEIDTPKSSTLNLLRALVAHGYIDHIDGVYLLGKRSFQLASAIIVRRRFPEVARPVLKWLADETRATAMIAELTAEGDEYIYIAKEEARQPLRLAAAVGDRRPLHASAGGIAMLAHMPAEFVTRYLKTAPLTKVTPLTETDPRKILANIAQARKDGVALTTGALAQGVSAIGAPIFDADGLLGVVVVGMPTERFERSDKSVLISRTLKATHDISAIMGGA